MPRAWCERDSFLNATRKFVMRTTLSVSDWKLPVCDQGSRFQPRWAARFGKRQQCDNTISATARNFTRNFRDRWRFQRLLKGAGTTWTKNIQHDCFRHDARQRSSGTPQASLASRTGPGLIIGAWGFTNKNNGLVWPDSRCVSDELSKA